MVRWVEAVLRQPSMAGGSATSLLTQRVNMADGWLVDDDSGEISRPEAFRGKKAEAGWFPDEAVVMARFGIIGACNAFPIGHATDVLGPGTMRSGGNESTWSCEYVRTDSTGSRRSVAVSFSGWGQFSALSRNEARERFAANQLPRGGQPRPNLADAAYFTSGPGADCSTLAALKASEIIQVTACGKGAGNPPDSALLDRILRRILGLQ